MIGSFQNRSKSGVQGGNRPSVASNPGSPGNENTGFDNSAFKPTGGLTSVDENAGQGDGQDALRQAGDATPTSASRADLDGTEENRQIARQRTSKLLEDDSPKTGISRKNSMAENVEIQRSSFNRWRRKTWSFLEEPDSGKPAFYFFQFRSILYFTSAALPLFGMHHEIGQAAAVGEPLDDTFNVILLADVILRVIVCPSPRSFFRDPFHWFDSLACVPFIVRLACENSTSSACAPTPGGFYLLIGHLRPLLRMLKVTRHVGGFSLMVEVIRRSMEGLGVPTFLMCLLIAFFAATIYWIEEEEQSFMSVPEVVWFCVVTISTVGYGDVSPVTPGGRFLGVLLILTGLAAFAMPLGVISGNFSAVYENKDEILLMRRVQRRLKSSGIGPEKIVDALLSIDSSGDGKLDYMEFSGLLMGLDVGFSEDNSRSLFDFFDDDKSGSLDYGEFLEKVFPGCEKYVTLPTIAVQASNSANVSLEDVLKSVNEVQNRLQKMNLDLERLSSSTNSRLGAVESRVKNHQVTHPPPPTTDKPISTVSPSAIEGGWLGLAKAAKAPPDIPPAADLEARFDAAEDQVDEAMISDELRKMSDGKLDDSPKLVNDDRKKLPEKPAQLSPDPKAPSSPAPALPQRLPGSLEEDDENGCSS